MEEILELIEIYKEDNPTAVITRDMIEELIEEYKDLLISEIEDRV